MMRTTLLLFTFMCIALLSLFGENGVATNDLTKLLEKAKFYIQNDNDSALIFINRAKDLATKTNSKIDIVRSLEAEGNFYGTVKSDYNRATQLFMKGIELCEKENLNYTKNIYTSLGVMFHITDNYKKAQYYYTKANELARKERDTLLIVRTLVNLGSINSSLSNYAMAEKLYLESLTYPSTPYIRRSTLSNLGNMNIRIKHYREAIRFLNQAVRINTNGASDDALDYSYLLNAKKESRDFSGSDTLMSKCIELSKQNNDLRNKSLLLRSIAEFFDAMGQFEKASFYKDQYILAYDSLKHQQRDDIVYEVETKYQTQKKEEEILKQQEEKKELFVLFVVSVVVILLLTFLVYTNLRQKKTLRAQTKRLETLVDEKNILLRETHHRVKNSFQIVSSLLYLQSENMHDKEAALAVKEAQNRVKSMVLIHQKLYNKDNLVGIETKEYIEDLVRDIVENQTDAIQNLTTNISIENRVFTIDTITPIGLIINELITNCIKHAFDQSIKNPTIDILFTKEQNHFLLQVNDNGVGLKEAIKESSFGIKLINALAKKLKAKPRFESVNGTQFSMEIHKFEEMTLKQ